MERDGKPIKARGGLESKALIIYRQNSKLDSIRDIIEKKLKEEEEHDFIENYSKIEAKVFPEGTSEEEISEWASNQDFDLGDLLLTDQTFKRSIAGKSITNKIGEKFYSLDKIYERACKEAAIVAPKRIMQKAGETHRQKIRAESKVEEYAKAIKSFNTKINKIYLAIPNITDHQFYGIREEIKNSLQKSDFRAGDGPLSF